MSDDTTIDTWDSVEEKTSYTTEELDALVKDMLDKRDDYDTVKKVAAEAEEKYRLSRNRILAALQALGKSKYYAEGLGTISKVVSYRVTVPKTDSAKQTFFSYLQERGLFDSMATVNYQTLNAFYNQEVEAAQARGEILNMPGIDLPVAEENIRFTKERSK